MKNLPADHKKNCSPNNSGWISSRKYGFSSLCRRNPKISILALIIFALAISSCSGYELKNEFSLRFRKLFGKVLKQGLVLDKNPLGGMVEGVYRDGQGQKIEFFAGDGGANLLLFTNRQAPPMSLYVSSVYSADASMRLNYYDINGNWHTVTMDGWGALTAEEQNAMADLMNTGLVESIMLLPLDLACQGEDQVIQAQVAALLYPVQMLYKYQVTDRAAMTEKLMTLSECDYGYRGETVNSRMSEIMMTPANPVPVVLGFFPFDHEGAVEASTTGDISNKMACLDSSVWSAGIETGSTRAVESSPASDSIIGQYGPCEAKCRGACGSDCSLNNCTLESENRCEKDENGENTGSWSIFHKYTCGLHPACIKHDACYDDCNRRHGCGTWAATFCKHSVTVVTAPFEYFTDSYLSCDSNTLIEENPLNVKDWVRGYGPKTTTQVFEYRSEKFRYIRDTYECPTRPAEDETRIEQPVVQPPPEPKNEPELAPAEEVPPQKTEWENLCSFLPDGGSIWSETHDSCVKLYSWDPLISVLITYMDSAPDYSTISCTENFEASFALIIEEVNLGNCGVARLINYNRTPTMSDHQEWSINFVYDHYMVIVGTDVPYDANKVLMEGYAAEVEEKIMNYLD